MGSLAPGFWLAWHQQTKSEGERSVIFVIFISWNSFQLGYSVRN